MFDTIKNIGTTIVVAGAITSSGWWLIKPHAADFVDGVLKERGYALQDQVDEANETLNDQGRSIEQNNRIAVETRDKVIILENKLEEILNAIQEQGQ